MYIKYTLGRQNFIMTIEIYELSKYVLLTMIITFTA